MKWWQSMNMATELPTLTSLTCAVEIRAHRLLRYCYFFFCEEEDKDLLYTKKKTITHQFTSDKILYLSTYILKQT